MSHRVSSTLRLSRHSRLAPSRQRGAAALIIVMLLFFVISLVAAYTSRNLIFEQRTAANQYRSTQALEAAEAGMEWALAKLNGGLIDGSCTATTTSTELSFRQRYLDIDNVTGAVTPRAASGLGSVEPMCVLNTSSGSAADWSWSCVCPPINAAFTPLAAPGGTGPAPAFVVQAVPVPGAGARADLFQLEVNSCTRLNTTDCVNFNFDRGGTGDGVATVRATVALRGALTRLPSAALTVAGTLTAPPSSVLLTLINDSAVANGVTLHTGGTVPGSGLVLRGLPGATAASTVVAGDSSLTPTAQGGFAAENLRFAMFFGMSPETYKRQPGLPVLDCSTINCDAAAINTAIQRNPGRPIWLAGSAATVNIDGAIPATTGTQALLIVEGDVVFGGGGAVTGLLYNRTKSAGTTWTLPTSASVTGAAVVEGNLILNGSSSALSVTYNNAALRTLRAGTGTFVRVPGSWRDFL